MSCKIIAYTYFYYYCFPLLSARSHVYRVIRPEAMDDEVTQIFKKWKLNNGLPKKDSENINTTNHNANETFDSRTFTRPAKRRTFNTVDPITNISSLPSITATMTDSEPQSVESGVSVKINCVDIYFLYYIILKCMYVLFLDRIDKFKSSGWRWNDASFYAKKLAERCFTTSIDLHIDGLPK